MTMPGRTKLASDRDLQDAVITYLSDASLRRQQTSELPISAEQAARAHQFARFLARRYYRDRLVRSFRYSPLFRDVIGRSAEHVVDTAAFDGFLDECVLGSLPSAKRLAEITREFLTTSNQPGTWWGDLLDYELAFFLQAATAENTPSAALPQKGCSALLRRFHWNLPDLLPKIPTREPIADDLQSAVDLLFSRTREGRIYAVQVEAATKVVFEETNGLRSADQIATAAHISTESCASILTSLAQIGAVIMPAQTPNWS